MGFVPFGGACCHYVHFDIFLPWHQAWLFIRIALGEFLLLLIRGSLWLDTIYTE
jgi:hypothetical protein